MEISEKSEIGAIFERAVVAHNNWVNSDVDDAPAVFWRDALQSAAAVAKNETDARFLAVRAKFAAFAAACRPYLSRGVAGTARIDTRRASTDSAIWYAWRDILTALDEYDRRQRRAVEKTTRSTRSIDELRKTGVSSRQICRILGFWRDDDAGGSPDLGRLARAESGDASAFDGPTTASAAPGNYSEPTAADPALPPPGTDNKNVKEDFSNSLDFFILEGLPPRQIAARLALDVEDVLRRFNDLGVFHADGTISLTPRAQIAAKTWFQENPDGTYSDCAEAVSTANKLVTGEDVATFMERVREGEGLVEIYSELETEENVLPVPETDAQNVDGKKRRKR